MQYIKSYKIFESASHISIEDIKDICLEISDRGIPVVYAEPQYNSRYFPMSDNYIFISNSVATKWIDVKDTILRLIDYLGNNFIRMSFRDSNLNLKCYQDSPFNKTLSEIKDDDIVRSINFNYFMETPYSWIDKSIYDINLGDFTKFTELEIHTIDDLLKPFKSRHHSDDPDYIKRSTEYEFSTFNRSIVFYPMRKASSRSGYNWFLTQDCKLKEVCVAKYTSGYFEVRMIGHSFLDSVDVYIVKDLDSLVQLIEDKI